MGAERRGEPRRHRLQAQVASNAVLKMNDVIALLQFGKIDVQQRAAGLGVRRFEAARALHLVAAKNLRVGHHGQLGGLEKKAPGQGARRVFAVDWSGPGRIPPKLPRTAAVRRRCCRRRTPRSPGASSDGAARKTPCAALRRCAPPADGRRWAGKPPAPGRQATSPGRSVRIRRIRRSPDSFPPVTERRRRRLFREKFLQLAHAHRNHPAPRHFVLEFPPGNQQRVPGLNLRFITPGMLVQTLRIAEQKQRPGKADNPASSPPGSPPVAANWRSPPMPLFPPASW